MTKKKAATKTPTQAPAKTAPADPKLSAGKKAAATKAAKASAAVATPKEKPKEVDVKNLSEAETRKRCVAIYRLERTIESKRAVHDVAKRSAASAKKALTDAEDALAKEINDQRFGPGPLFNATGDGPA